MGLVCLVLDEHHPAEAARAQGLQPLEVVEDGRVLGQEDNNHSHDNHA